MADLQQLLAEDNVTASVIESHLANLPPDTREKEVTDIRGNGMSRLFTLCEGYRPLTLAHVVPTHVPVMQEVAYRGRNNMAAFSWFHKVFCRPPNGDEKLWGYNRNSGFVETVVGPGYYVGRPRNGAIELDCNELPTNTPKSWPLLRPANTRISYFVYRNLSDELRYVAEGVMVGRASRKGKPMNNWFVLSRVPMT